MAAFTFCTWAGGFGLLAGWLAHWMMSWTTPHGGVFKSRRSSIVAVMLTLTLVGTWLAGYGPNSNCCDIPSAGVTNPAKGAMASSPVNMLQSGGGNDSSMKSPPAATVTPVPSDTLRRVSPSIMSSAHARQATPDAVPQGSMHDRRPGQVSASASKVGSGNANCNSPLALSLTFNSGSAELTHEAIQKLLQVAGCIKQPVLIAGHTDNVGDARSNQALSERRAQAVSNYLASQGVLFLRLQVKGFGQAMPIAENATAEGRAKNNRIEISTL